MKEGLEMKDFTRIMTCVNLVVLVSTIPYSAATWLNAIFTFKYLPVAAIPFYDPTLPGTLGSTYSDRYNFEWWDLWSDITYPMLPLLYQFILIYQVLYGGKEFLMLGAIASVFIGVLTLLKLIWRSYAWWFCVDIQFCRNYVPGNCVQKFNCPASVLWQWAVIYTLVFFVIIILYVVFYPMYYSQTDDFHRSLEENGFEYEEPEEKPKKKEPDGNVRWALGIVKTMIKKRFPAVFNKKRQ